MKVMLLFLLLAIRFLLKYNLGNAFVAASEDSVTSVSDSSDISLFATDSMFELNDQEDPLLSFDSTTGANDQEDYFNDIPISPVPAYVDIPFTSAFNVHPPPEGFNPCPKGSKYACCLGVDFFLSYPLNCVWYDFDIYIAPVKEYMCQDEFIYCCGDIVNGGLKENGGTGNQGIDCELATRSAFRDVQPEQQNEFDWTDLILNILRTPVPLPQIAPPFASPDGS